MSIFLALQINKSKGIKKTPTMYHLKCSCKILFPFAHSWGESNRSINRPQCFLYDRAERNGFWPRLLLFFSPFLFPPKKVEDEKENELAKIVMKSHAFLLDLLVYFRIWNITNSCLLNKGQRPSTLKHSILNFYFWFFLAEKCILSQKISSLKTCMQKLCKCILVLSEQKRFYNRETNINPPFLLCNSIYQPFS